MGLIMPVKGNALEQPLAERALLLIRHPARAPRPRAAALRQVFGLTAAEAALAAGSDLHEIAETRRITYATLRAQLRAVMAKTGTRRQGELIALAHRTAALDLEVSQPRSGGQ